MCDPYDPKDHISTGTYTGFFTRLPLYILLIILVWLRPCSEVSHVAPDGDGSAVGQHIRASLRWAGLSPEGLCLGVIRHELQTHRCCLRVLSPPPSSTRAPPPRSLSSRVPYWASCFYSPFRSPLIKIIVVNNSLWNLCHHSSLCRLDLRVFTNLAFCFLCKSLLIVANCLSPVALSPVPNIHPDIPLHPSLPLPDLLLSSGNGLTAGSDTDLHHYHILHPCSFFFFFFKLKHS